MAKPRTRNLVLFSASFSDGAGSAVFQASSEDVNPDGALHSAILGGSHLADDDLGDDGALADD